MVLRSLAVLLLGLSTSCKTFFPSVMYDVDAELTEGNFATTEPSEYAIQPGDRLTLAVFTNKAYNQVNTMIAGFGGTGTAGGALEFTVQLDSQVFLPVIGYYKIAGQTIPEAQAFLAVIYDSKGFTDPLVTMEVANRTVLVYVGGTASVVELKKEAVTLIEVLTLAGGLSDKAKAHRVMLIRKISGQRVVQMIDMSDEDALANGELIIHPDDIIYVQTVKPFTVAITQVTQYIAIASSLITAFLAYKAITSP